MRVCQIFHKILNKNLADLPKTSGDKRVMIVFGQNGVSLDLRNHWFLKFRDMLPHRGQCLVNLSSETAAGQVALITGVHYQPHAVTSKKKKKRMIRSCLRLSCLETENCLWSNRCSALWALGRSSRCISLNSTFHWRHWRMMCRCLSSTESVEKLLSGWKRLHVFGSILCFKWRLKRRLKTTTTWGWKPL